MTVFRSDVQLTTIVAQLEMTHLSIVGLMTILAKSSKDANQLQAAGVNLADAAWAIEQAGRAIIDLIETTRPDAPGSHH